MWAADVVELDSIIINVVEDCKTGLLTSSVRLWLSLDSGVGPGKTTGTDGLGTTVGPLKCVTVWWNMENIYKDS